MTSTSAETKAAASAASGTAEANHTNHSNDATTNNNNAKKNTKQRRKKKKSHSHASKNDTQDSSTEQENEAKVRGDGYPAGHMASMAVIRAAFCHDGRCWFIHSGCTKDENTNSFRCIFFFVYDNHDNRT